MIMTLKNQDPKILKDIFNYLLSLCSEYGWFVLLVTIICFLVWKKYFEDQFYRWKDEREERRRDPTMVVSQQESLEVARRRMQERYDAQVERFKEEQREKERLKKETVDQLLKDNNKKDEKKDSYASKPLRSGFNALSGQSGSSGSMFRARKCAPSGG